MLMYGVDRAKEFRNLFLGRTALITAPTGRSSRGESTASVLKRICDLRVLLAPEHGLRGNRAAGECFGSEIDPETGLDVLSLYSHSSKRLPPELFDRVDTVVYDIQDVGCRYYTFISTLKFLVQDCALHAKRLVVLDRPNPLGDRVEGMTLRQGMESFVGCHDIPVCYGLTCGEFAQMIRAETAPECDLHVIPCTGWHREQTFPEWGKEWIRPSPNLHDFPAALLYPGTCLLEGTNLSEGRGTDAPFSVLGAPFVDGRVLCDAFAALACPGVAAEPIRFTPTTSKHQGVPCGGIRLRITDASEIRPTELGIRLLRLLMDLYPEELQLTSGEGDLPFLSQLAGHRLFEQPDWDPEELIVLSRQDAAAFRQRKRKYECY